MFRRNHSWLPCAQKSQQCIAYSSWLSDCPESGMMVSPKTKEGSPALLHAGRQALVKLSICSGCTLRSFLFLPEGRIPFFGYGRPTTTIRATCSPRDLYKKLCGWPSAFDTNSVLGFMRTAAAKRGGNTFTMSRSLLRSHAQ